jgi:hypothetical protein
LLFMGGEDNSFISVTYKSRRQRGAENIFEEEEEVRENQPEVGQVENMGDTNEERGLQILESVVALMHTCKRELSPAHLVCPRRHNV